jgi:hypothetical protein
MKGRAMGTSPRTAVRRLALARAVSETGSAAAYTALLDAVFIRSGGSAAWLGLALLLTHGVAGAFGPFGGVPIARPFISPAPPLDELHGRRGHG